MKAAFSSASSRLHGVLPPYTDAFLHKVRGEITHLDEVCASIPDEEEWDAQVRKFELALNWIEDAAEDFMAAEREARVLLILAENERFSCLKAKVWELEDTVRSLSRERDARVSELESLRGRRSAFCCRDPGGPN